MKASRVGGPEDKGISEIPAPPSSPREHGPYPESSSRREGGAEEVGTEQEPQTAEEKHRRAGGLAWLDPMPTPSPAWAALVTALSLCGPSVHQPLGLAELGPVPA